MHKINSLKLKKANSQTFKGISKMLPLIFGMLLLVSIIDVLVPKTFYQNIFTGNSIFDAIKGAILGSTFTGNPVTGYILGSTFLKANISLINVTTFIVSWVTVGLVQIPAEILALGKRFAIYRNSIAFFMAIIVAIVTVFIVNII